MATLVDGIYGFSGNFNFLSNFWMSEVVFEGLVYPSSEHAYQAAKTLDQSLRIQILNASTPGKAKRMGQQLKIRDDWEDIKIDVMYSILQDKFSHLDLALKLVATGDLYIEETNYWGDKFWGVCNGEGKNHLGLLLMKIRNELRRVNQLRTGTAWKAVGTC